jgi:hypothetical protein
MNSFLSECRHFDEELVPLYGKKSLNTQNIAFTSSTIALPVEIAEMSRYLDMTAQFV